MSYNLPITDDLSIVDDVSIADDVSSPISSSISSVSSDVTVLDVDIRSRYSSHMDALYHMEQQGVRHLGWLNSGIDIPGHYCFRMIYNNWSGSSCLYVDPIYRVSYSVDMGD